MSEERIKLDPLINRRVIFKLRDHEQTLEATILGFDETGYWVRGGTLCDFLPRRESLPTDIRFLEFTRIQWFQAAPTSS
jgi:hypothetical protein